MDLHKTPVFPDGRPLPPPPPYAMSTYVLSQHAWEVAALNKRITNLALQTVLLTEKNVRLSEELTGQEYVTDMKSEEITNLEKENLRLRKLFYLTHQELALARAADKPPPPKVPYIKSENYSIRQIGLPTAFFKGEKKVAKLGMVLCKPTGLCNKFPMVYWVEENTPAAMMNVRPGQYLMSINGISLDKYSHQEATNLLRKARHAAQMHDAKDVLVHIGICDNVMERTMCYTLPAVNISSLKDQSTSSDVDPDPPAVAQARVSLKAVRRVPAELRTAAQWHFLHNMQRFENRLDCLAAYELRLLPVLTEPARPRSPPRPPPDTTDMPVLEPNDLWEEDEWPQGRIERHPLDLGLCTEEEEESEEEGEAGVMVAPEP